MRAIPTRFEGGHFRSRLEARWAAFFTALGWQWEYEPFDLDGYIPDFLITMDRLSVPLLVEVKPLCPSEQAGWEEPLRKVVASGWSGSACVVGIGPSKLTRSATIEFGRYLRRQELAGDVLPIVLHWCGNTPALLVAGGCIRCSEICEKPWDLPGHSFGIDVEWLTVWREATSQVRWRGRGA